MFDLFAINRSLARILMIYFLLLFIFIVSIGSSGAFWLFGAFCVVSLFFVIFYVPETQGQTLEDIERKMMGRVRRMSSVANIKPLSFNM